MEWNEDYTDPQSHFARLTQCEAQPGAYACVRKIVTGTARQHPAGEQWSYFPAAPAAWGYLERATGMSLAARLNRLYGSRRDGPRRRVACLSAREARRRRPRFNATLKTGAALVIRRP